MPRIACLWVPDLYVRAHARLDPELTDVPLALTDGRGPRSVIVATSARAHECGVRTGMRATEARAMCNGIVIRPVSTEALAAASAVLADVAGTVSARVDIGDRERV